MTTTPKTLGTKLVELCKSGNNLEAIETLYADDIVSVEASPSPGWEQTIQGKDAVLGKAKHWNENTEVHSAEVFGPFPHGEDKFAVRFVMDATLKPMNHRSQMDEVAVYQVKDGKIVREEFFYDMGA